MNEPRLSKNEIRKDTVQSAVEAGADTVQDVARIVTGAVKEVAGALGNLATEIFELRDQAKAASQDVPADED